MIFLGTWGTAIFSDDLACDIKDDYIKHIIKGRTSEEATELLKNEVLPELEDDELPVFWIALAMAQWQKGRLVDEVKDKAISYLDSGGDLERWSDSPQNYAKREKVLEAAREKLMSPMPEAKIIPVPSWMRSEPWSVGDIFVYKIAREVLPYSEYTGRYVLLRVIKMAFSHINERHYAEYAVYAWHGLEPPDPSQISTFPFLKLYEANVGTPEYFYQIACHIEFDKKTEKKHEFRRIATDASFSPDSDGLIRSGEIRGTTSADSFDILLSKAFHNAQL